MGKFHYNDWAEVMSATNIVKVTADDTVGFYIEYFISGAGNSVTAVGCFVPTGTKDFGTFIEKNDHASGNTTWKMSPGNAADVAS